MDSIKLITLLSAITTFALVGAAHADSIYRWIDKNGNPHFTRTPPPENADYDEVEGSSTKPDGEESEPDASEESDKELTAEEKYADQLAKLQKQKKQACKQAKKNKQYLLNKHKIRMKQSDGSTKTLSHQEKIKQLEMADEAIQANCQ